MSLDLRKKRIQRIMRIYAQTHVLTHEIRGYKFVTFIQFGGSSSILSPQSLCPSHTQLLGMQVLSLQRNSVGPQLSSI